MVNQKRKIEKRSKKNKMKKKINAVKSNEK